MKNLGTTCQGRALLLVRLGNGPKKQLVLAGMHAREHITCAFVMKSIFYLLEQSAFRDIFKGTSLYLCPMVNPDGVEIALENALPNIKTEDFIPSLYKNNANNVNLNANFPYLFSFAPAQRQPGKSPASERETKVVINLCEKNRFCAALSFHARGNCIFWQDSGNGSINGDFNLAKELGSLCGYTLMPQTKERSAYCAGFENWFRHRFSRPALCVELVKDNELPFENMYEDFFNCVNWQQTKDTLLTFINHKFN